jgi:hypothetical protein
VSAHQVEVRLSEVPAGEVRIVEVRTKKIDGYTRIIGYPLLQRIPTLETYGYQILISHTL